jgi:NAD(P)-dependent dehydrogenase (short-subunit alcohol dehydrogenase family)
MAAQRLVEDGHDVVLHARDDERARDAITAVRGAGEVLVGDLSSIAQTLAVAEQANSSGRFDAIIHNAGVGPNEPRRIQTADGLAHVFAIDVLAPYLLTALIEPPRRLIYLSSGMHRSGNANLTDLQWQQRHWDSTQAYCDAKLFDVVLAFAVARLWHDACSNAVEPGWVATKMGGPNAPEGLEIGSTTQVWLAVSDDPKATVSGRYFYHQRTRECHPAASDIAIQEGLLAACGGLTGVALPTLPRAPAGQRGSSGGRAS